jgi:hypothetical protein
VTDNQRIAVLITVIQAGLTTQSISVGIKQSYQPTVQGAPSAPYVFIHKLGGTRYGSPQRSDLYLSPGVTTHTETQLKLNTYQVNALAIQNPTNTASLTASDYLNAVAFALNSEMGITALKAQGIGILRIASEPQVMVRDEKALNEASPSFDFTVCDIDVLSLAIGSTKLIEATTFAILP